MYVVREIDLRHYGKPDGPGFKGGILPLFIIAFYIIVGVNHVAGGGEEPDGEGSKNGKKG